MGHRHLMSFSINIETAPLVWLQKFHEHKHYRATFLNSGRDARRASHHYQRPKWKFFSFKIKLSLATRAGDAQREYLPIKNNKLKY